jgi:hypothetical protein
MAEYKSAVCGSFLFRQNISLLPLPNISVNRKEVK